MVYVALVRLAWHNIDATGVLHLVQGMRNWPLLGTPCMSAQGLDEKACLLLSITEAYKCGLLPAQQLDALPREACLWDCSALPQVSQLRGVLSN